MQTRAEGNPFGVSEALLGLFCGFFLSVAVVSIYASLAHVRAGQTTYWQTVLSLFALWAGLLGAVAAGSRLRGLARRVGRQEGPLGLAVVQDYGLALRPLPDLPLGVAVGLLSQFVLVPVFELPLVPFVPHLYNKLGRPAHELLGKATSGSEAGLVFLALLVCLGSPLVEELFFRGLLLRGLLGKMGKIGGRLGPAVSIVLTGLVFALVHFETLQLLGLAAFGSVLGVLAWRTGRLGPSIIAHVTFNTTTVVAYVFTR
jgi:membrane protease YdiL (CAAX protease family)